LEIFPVSTWAFRTHCSGLMSWRAGYRVGKGTC
jgi:hypothetical protein